LRDLYDDEISEKEYSIVWIEWNNLIECMKIYEASLRLLSECLKIDGYS